MINGIYKYGARRYCKMITNIVNIPRILKGRSVLDEDQKKKGLLPRVVDGLFEGMKSFGEMTKWTVKLTMVRKAF